MAMNDVMMSFKDNGLATSYIGMDEIRRRCPVAFATEPTNDKVTEKYVLASTATVIKDMEKLGWKVIDAKQRKPRKAEDKRFSFHMIAFQNPDVSIVKTLDDGTTEIECWPRIILTNSHDGKNSFKFMVGLFRLVCSNGLIVSTQNFSDVRIRHINYTFEELREVVNKAIEALPTQIMLLNDMRATELTDKEKRSLALDMLRIKRHDDKLEVADETIEEMLTPVRKEDEGNDLFTVFNIIQEKLVKGGFTLTKKDSDKKGRKVRPVKSFAADLYLNEELFKKASEYMPLYEAA
jgi:hypothetical protein